MSFYDAGDAAIFYESLGQGKPFGRPIVFLHGYALNSGMWEFQKPIVAAKYQMITIDLRGFGQSSCGKRWSGDVMVEDITGLLNELDLHDCTMVGFSMSGPVAFRLALTIPERINRLILASSILPSLGRKHNETETASEHEELETLTLHGAVAWAEKIGLREGPLIGNTFKRNPKAKDVWEKMLARHNPDYLRAMMEARREKPISQNWRERLAGIKQPTMIIAGAQDASFIDASRYLARTIPGAQLEIISGAGHMVNLEKPEEFNQVLMGFLENKS